MLLNVDSKYITSWNLNLRNKENKEELTASFFGQTTEVLSPNFTIQFR